MKKSNFAIDHIESLSKKRFMIVMVILAAALFLGGGIQAQAVVTINFDNFTSGAYGADFLAPYGIPSITIGGVAGPRGPLIIDMSNTTYYWGFKVPSLPNIFRQQHDPDLLYQGRNQPQWLEFEFSPELVSFSLTRIGFRPARSMPQWQATFYDAQGLFLGSFQEFCPPGTGLVPYCFLYGYNYELPKVFLFDAPDGKTIAKMRLTSWWHSCTFRNIGVDDFVLTPADSDGDGVNDDVDNCPDVANPGQSNIDGDEDGDLCDDCPADYDNLCDPDGSAAESIGQTGGTVSTPDESVEINIPEGALQNKTTISITDAGSDFALTTNQGQGISVFGVDIGPDGTQFDTPVTIIFAWEDGDNNGIIDGTNIKEAKLRISKDGAVITAACPNDPGCDAAANTFMITISGLSEFVLFSPADADGDGVSDSYGGQTDMCPETVIPEAAPTSGTLRYNRWALMDDDGGFDTNQPPGGGTSASFTIEDTAGCSCEQIIDELGLGKNHLKNGCSTSAMSQWVEMVDSP